MENKERDVTSGITRRDFIERTPLAVGTLAMMPNVLAKSNHNQKTDASVTKFVVGIQAHAHDFLYEGTDNVIETARSKAGVNAVLVCATYVKERMRLPHNPKFSRYPTQGGFYFNFDPKLYANSRIKPVRTPEKNVGEFDAVKTVSEACRKLGAKFYAWVSSFNFPQEAPSYPEHQVVGANGQRHTGWLCPNSPEARDFSLKIYEDIVRNYDIDGVFVDRFRFPDDISTCFCEHCIREMRNRGLNPDRIRRAILSVASKTSEMSYLSLMTLGMNIEPAFYIPELPEFAELVRFKMDTITGYIESLYERIKSINSRTEVGLDMFSPSVAWHVGQEPAALAQYCDWIKPMVYHLGDGYYAIRAITAMSSEGVGTIKQLYGDMRRMLRAKGMQLPDTFDEFRRTSFPTSWIQTETELTRKLTRAQKPIYPGIQLWQPTTPDTVSEAIRAAVRANSNGVFLYCYGWSPLENLEAAGRTLRTLALI